ncbi:hypothetical protein IF650_18075 [Cellulosimicrobium terreum]|nr:hypothetical protein [Cellulosimicrobium terreum]
MSTHDDAAADGLDGIEIPDDLSGLTGPSDPDLVVLITQVAGAEPLAAACSLAQVEADVVATDVGALALLRDRSGDAPAQAAAALTTLVKGAPLILVERRGEQLAMTRWSDGAPGDQLAPGLVLGGAPELLEDLLTGSTTLADLDGVVASSSVSRWKAVRLLTAAARRAKKGGA